MDIDRNAPVRVPQIPALTPVVSPPDPTTETGALLRNIYAVSDAVSRNRVRATALRYRLDQHAGAVDHAKRRDGIRRGGTTTRPGCRLEPV